MDTAARERNRRIGSRSGHAVIEVALMAPWIFFLFVGVFDFGFYAYAAIATENAARVAVLHTSSSIDMVLDQTTACQLVLGELRALPNVGPGTTDCSNSRVNLVLRRLDDSTNPPSADGSVSAQVALTYTTIQMIPIPGLLMGQMPLTRVVEMRVKED